MIVQKAGGSVMAKDDSLKKPKKIDVNRIMIFISSILIPFLWIDLYLVLKNASKMMVVGIIAALILVWTGLLVTYIHRMKNEEKAHSDEQVEELLRTGKANYLMQKKLAEKIDNIGEKDAVPADEIITAQKAIAKLMLARNKENTDALMHSNEQVIEKTLEVEEKLSENSQQIMDMQRNLMDEKLQELTQSQKLVLDNLNDVKESLQSDMQDVLSNMIHDTLEKELASAIEQIHTYVKEAVSQAVGSVKENPAAEVPVMAAVSPAMDEELPDPGMPAESEELPDSGMPTEDEELPDSGMPTEDEELPDLGVPTEDEELPDLGMPAMDEDLSNMELPTLGEELSETELPDLTDGGDLDEEPSIGEMPLMEEEEPEAADTSLIDEEPSIGEMPVFDDLNDAASAVEEVQAEPVEEVEAEEVPITEEATVEPDTDAVTLTEEIPVSADESVIEEVKIPEETTVTEEIPVSADESVIEEVPAQEASSSMADMSNPNKIMTPDEIAALIANL
ncbi:hypothetical protein DWZ31_12655 [Roseburia intestinalis]|uniref:Uncharacterized protein n=2 Tax=Roseburia intestinalis TaxID=166486 RepID=A0A415TSF0_9FIRM|nr:hypothetical protein DWZ31_12655 [Roseburia intestinalis]